MRKKSGLTPSKSDEAVEELKHGIVDLAESYKVEPKKIADLVAFSSRFYNYSFRNKALIFIQNPAATFVASYKRWNDEFGCKITSGKGSSIKILKPVIATLFRAPDSEQWNPLKTATKQEKEKIKSGEYDTKTYTRFKPISVFDISQTDCPKENYPLFYSMGRSSEEHAKIYQQLKNFAISKGILVVEADLISISLRGAYTPATNSIRINNLLEDTEKLSTLTHEFGHALLHSNPNEEKPVPQKEFEADTFCIMLETEFGIDLTDGRKTHLADCYRKIQSYNAAHNDQENEIDVNQCLNSVTGAYNDFINGFHDFVSIDRQQEQQQGLEQDNSIADYFKHDHRASQRNAEMEL